MEGTFLAILPAIIAIVLALITKEVYVSLFLGIFTGAMLIGRGNPIVAFGEMFELMSQNLGGEKGLILIFTIMLGILVVLMTKAGGAQAYGLWATKKIKTRRAAQTATAVFGVALFIDDYFNCMTNASVMRPIAENSRVSRVKLAYIIGSIAASTCILVPISSWAAAISGSVPEMFDGFKIFVKAIPYNFYAILTIATVFVISITGLDFAKMKKREKNAALHNDLDSGIKPEGLEELNEEISPRGRVIDLVLPLLVLIITTIGSMIYTGYFYVDGVWHSSPQFHSFVRAIGNTSASLSLCIGSTVAVIFAAILYLPRKVLSFKKFTSSFVEGFKSMVGVTLILILAWSLSSVCEALDLNAFVTKLTGDKINGLMAPALFLIAVGISFSTGSSWATFGIMVPLVAHLFTQDPTNHLFIICVSACLSGAIVGDHMSPISDNTILSSAGAKCNHLDYISCLIPYALCIAGISLVGFLLIGLMPDMLWLVWLILIALFVAMFVIIYFINKKNKDKEALQAETEGENASSDAAPSSAEASADAESLINTPGTCIDNSGNSIEAPADT